MTVTGSTTSYFIIGTGTATPAYPNKRDATPAPVPAEDVEIAVCQVTVVPSSVPTYALACSGSVRYSSACSCWGITASTITVATPTISTTVTVTSTTTVVVTATAPVTIGGKSPSPSALCLQDNVLIRFLSHSLCCLRQLRSQLQRRLRNESRRSDRPRH